MVNIIINLNFENVKDNRYLLLFLKIKFIEVTLE